jgi:hypothetical protein
MTTTDKPMSHDEIMAGYVQLEVVRSRRDAAAVWCAEAVLSGPAYKGVAKEHANMYRNLGTEATTLFAKLHAAVEAAAITPFVS